MMCQAQGCDNEFTPWVEKQQRCKECHKNRHPYINKNGNKIIIPSWYRSHKLHKPKKDEKALKREIIAGLHRCQWCNTDKNLTIDHIQPLSEGGTKTRENLQVLCSEHNTKKSYYDQRGIKTVPMVDLRKATALTIFNVLALSLNV